MKCPNCQVPLTPTPRDIKVRIHYPRYVKMGRTVIKRIKSEVTGTATYWRNAGLWSVNAKWVGDRLLTFGGEKDYMNGVELTEATHEEWEEDNKGYTDWGYE